MALTFEEAYTRLAEHGQEHVLRFWEKLNEKERAILLQQIEEIDFHTTDHLIERWVLNEPETEHFNHIEPVPVIPPVDPSRPDAREAKDTGEEALRAGRVGLLLVAGGQGTRLGYEGPKGAFPIGPLTGKSLFAYHAEKIRNIQRRYDCILPWYIMVSEANAEATRAFFEQHQFFGLNPTDVTFFVQRMVPCVDERGKFMLEAPYRLARNPNGHGGVIPAVVENGISKDCLRRGVDTLSYFQVDNWTVQVADPYFIGYHLLRGGEMSSKVHRREGPREAVGVHCLCDGVYRVIEYSALDLYPQLLETTPDGMPVYYAGNSAIHILNVPFIERVYAAYRQFPWWRAHKKIPFLNETGELIKPDKPNGYKFETFVFDALRFIRHKPIALEIRRHGEYTPIKQLRGENSVEAARQAMSDYWGEWLEAAGWSVPRDDKGHVSVLIEISPLFAWSKDELVQKLQGKPDKITGNVSITSDGALETSVG
ncbi:MAG TPA: UTP--glucose-1-phosphate uridylyltransferase [Candidatus Hydrogenedentes bacterium]|nr:UTP--glucose-1-phosphate uridylyltransferase [Candidatus Hydrogenedentota bacterium]HOL77025.1 UTP--glucose-1-phosphate uridylyltransferase [Candidatus Hydrogenedentota bacterium]HPO85792.1 UTP--glucose-1-phosphate uridylyltransferase [Candidatus Hydrogenedentota bacterium]